MQSNSPETDPNWTVEEKAFVEKLSKQAIQAIDNLLLSNAHTTWRKVAMVVALTMASLKGREHGIPDIFYAQRVQKLVEEGRLEAQGNLQNMRFSEVRLPNHM